MLVNSTHWTQSINRWANRPATVTSDGSVLVAANRHRVHSLDPNSGEQRWSADVGTHLEGALDAGDIVVVNSRKYISQSDDGAMPDVKALQEAIALDKATGKELWRRRMRDYQEPTVLANGDVYIIDHEDGKLHSLSPDSGQTEWTSKAEIPEYRYPKFGPKGEVLIFGRRDGLPEMTVQSSEGKALWSMRGRGLENSLKFSPDGDFSVIKEKSNSAQLRVLDSETGKAKWSKDLTGFESSRHDFTEQGDVLLRLRQDESLQFQLLDGKSGDEKWTTTAEKDSSFQESLGNSLITGVFKNWRQKDYTVSFTGRDLSTGEVTWSTDFQSHGDLQTIAKFSDQLLLQAPRPLEEEGRVMYALTAFDPASGKQWELETGNAVKSCRVMKPSGDLALRVGDHRLLVVDRETGAPKWHFDSKNLLNPSVLDGDRVLSTDLDGQIHALHEDSELVKTGFTPWVGDDYETNYGVITRTQSYKPLREVEVVLGGHLQKAVMYPYAMGTELGVGDHLLIRDKDANGELTADELQDLPTRADLVALDRDGNGYLSISETRKSPMLLWSDRDQDKLPSEDDIVSVLHDQNRDFTVDLDQFAMGRRFASAPKKRVNRG